MRQEGRGDDAGDRILHEFRLGAVFVAYPLVDRLEALAGYLVARPAALFGELHDRADGDRDAALGRCFHRAPLGVNLFVPRVFLAIGGPVAPDLFAVLAELVLQRSADRDPLLAVHVGVEVPQDVAHVGSSDLLDGGLEVIQVDLRNSHVGGISLVRNSHERGLPDVLGGQSAAR